jgi:aldose 1-epimerase
VPSCEVVPLEAFTTTEGRRIGRYQLRAGAYALEVIDAGCAITRLLVPDRSGAQDNIVLGYADLGEYLGTRREYFGAIVGRVANRIAHGEFELAGRTYRLATNDGRHHLHGGHSGFDRRSWQVARTDAGQTARIVFERRSDDGEEGYPGALSVRVAYTLSPQGELRLDYYATTGTTTLVNLTNHTYFNLAGEDRGDVLRHRVQIAADAFCVVDDGLVPTGELRSVDGTAFDLRAAAPIGQRLEGPDEQMAIAGGYDHCFVLRNAHDTSGELREACVLEDPESGRRLRVSTDQPGVQFYSGNFLDGTAVGSGGVRYARHAGLCLETQAFPDAPHHPGFPSIVVEPGRPYRAATAWRFEVLP